MFTPLVAPRIECKRACTQLSSLFASIGQRQIAFLSANFQPICDMQAQRDVRFGSKADTCNAKRYVRFTPNSDRESGIPAKACPLYPPKADMCGALVHVCFGPKADIRSALCEQVHSALAGPAVRFGSFR